MYRIVSLMLLMGATVSCFTQTRITFMIDMTDPNTKGLFDPSAGDKVILRGNFCDWSGNDYVLVGSNTNHIYSGEFVIESDSGEIIEYKYAILKENGEVFYETKANPEDLPYGNRKLTIGTRPENLPLEKYITNLYRLGNLGMDVMFPIHELQEDFQMVRQILEENHCCIYEYISKEEFDQLFDHQYKLIDKPMSPSEFFRILTPLTEKTGCGHTNLWMPGDFWDMASDNLFPLQIRIIEGKMVVAGSYCDSDQVPKGSIILAINGRTAVDIIDEMRANYSADAYNINFKRTSVEQRFPMIYARRFGFPEKYVVTYTMPGQKKIEKFTLTPATIKAVRAIVFQMHTIPELSLELLEEKSTAIMTINTFIYYDRVAFFKSFLDSCFTTIDERNIENLILDLRGNDGGDPFCAVPLFSYLASEPVPYFAEPYGKYAEFAKPITLPENRFTGNLFTFLDGRCFSTNGHFSALLKYHKIGKFIGTESGSTYTCNAGRDLMRYLKNTRMMLYFTRSSFSAAVTRMDKREPIKPDYPVRLTIEDFIDGRDLYMEMAMKLIENGIW